MFRSYNGLNDSTRTSGSVQKDYSISAFRKINILVKQIMLIKEPADMSSCHVMAYSYDSIALIYQEMLIMLFPGEYTIA